MNADEVRDVLGKALLFLAEARDTLHVKLDVEGDDEDTAFAKGCVAVAERELTALRDSLEPTTGPDDIPGPPEGEADPPTVFVPDPSRGPEETQP